MNEDIQNTTVISMLDDLLLDIDRTLQLSRESKLGKSNSTLSALDRCCEEFKQLDQECSEFKNKEEDRCKKINLECNELYHEIEMNQITENELKNQIKLLKSAWSENVSTEYDDDDEELSELMKRVCLLKEDINMKKKAIQHDLSQFQMGCLYYKKYLLFNVICESKDQVVFTIDRSAKKSVTQDFIRFKMKNKGMFFEYVEMHPKLKMEQSLVRRYHKTGDIQGFILAFWKAVNNFKIHEEGKEI